MYNSNDDTQNYPVCRLQLVVETFGHATSQNVKLLWNIFLSLPNLFPNSTLDQIIPLCGGGTNSLTPPPAIHTFTNNPNPHGNTNS